MTSVIGAGSSPISGINLPYMPDTSESADIQKALQLLYYGSTGLAVDTNGIYGSFKYLVGSPSFSGSITVGANIVTSATSVNIANTTSTTLNLGGAATTIGIGASTGTTTVNNNLTVNGSISGNIVGKVTVSQPGTASIGKIYIVQPSVVYTSASATIGTVTTSGGYWSAPVTVASNTSLYVGMTVTATAGAGTLGSGTITVTGITGGSTTGITVKSTASMTAGATTNMIFYQAPQNTSAGDLWFW